MADRTTRHGWIDLLVPDGPFLSAAALDKSTVGENWPIRLDAEQRNLLLAPPASEVGGGWDDHDWDGRRSRLEQLLTDLLGYQTGKTLKVGPGITAQHHIYRAKVHADFIVHAPNEPDDVRMVVICGTDASDVAERLQPLRSTNHDGWVSTPVQRAALLVRHVGAGLALVSNAQEHLLVNVITGTTGSAMWTTNGLEERAVQDAFVALLHKERILDRIAPTSKLIQLSQERQQELTDTLGKQIRRAAEVLVNAISRANRTTRGELLDGVTGHEVYAAATRVLMRTVFLLVAEERGLLPVAENQLYADEYAVSTLLDQLEEDEYRNRSAMQRRSSAWERLLALSRGLHSGVEHDRLRLPAYGGDLFDPDKHPFLEARVPAEHDEDGTVTEWRRIDVGVVDDHTILTVLRHLQIANGQRIGFRSLDVEQIGHVYESLLDHSAVIVQPDEGAVLGLVGKSGDEPEVPLRSLEEWTRKGRAELGKQLTKVNVAAEARSVYKLLDDGIDPDGDVAHTLNVAVGNDEHLRERVEPFAQLLRTDARGVALVFLPGDVYVTGTSSKRDSGTAYTPRGLAEEVAKHTLDPLIYEPGPHNEADESKWKLRPPSDLLELKICDPAVGSAAILVAAARYLAEAVLQSRIEYGELPENVLNTAASDTESLDVRVEARRDVVSNCMYGVDRDPMAVEMAKLSLWLVTMSKDRPFTFLNHAIRHGDSLLGITSLDQLRKLHLEPDEVAGPGRGLAVQFGGENWWELVDESIGRLIKLRASLREIHVDDIEDARRKAQLHEEAVGATNDLSLIADAVCAAYLSKAAGSAADRGAALAALGPSVAGLETARGAIRNEAEYRLEADNPNPLVPRRPMHWPLAFPEVFIDGSGFDAIVANPPFIKSQGLRDSVGSSYRDYCSTYLAAGRKGKADFIAYFAWRITQIARRSGFLATNSIAQGDTLKLGLLPISRSWTIYRGVRSTPWPGNAGVHISKIWMTRDGWSGMFILEDAPVPGIASSLEATGDVKGRPLQLRENENRAFQGYQVIADGFGISKSEADAMMASDPESAEVIRPFVNGDSLNGPPPFDARDRRIIDFGTMSHAQARRYSAAFAHVEKHAKPEIERKATPKHDGKPSSYERWAETWWQFWSPRVSMRKAIGNLTEVLALVRTSKVFYPVFVPSDWCLTDSLIVFAYDDIGHFGVLTSAFHWWWAIKPPGTGGSSFKSDPRYTTDTSFRTFPQPSVTREVEAAAGALNGFRQTWMQSEGLGLRDIYRCANEPEDMSSSPVRLRQLHVELDIAVRDAYSACDPHHEWRRLELDHDFYDCGYLGTRYTLSEATRDRMLAWLLELNFRRYAQEKGLTYETVLKETGNA